MVKLGVGSQNHMRLWWAKLSLILLSQCAASVKLEQIVMVSCAIASESCVKLGTAEV